LSNMLAVVRIRGLVGIKKGVSDTFKILRLNRKMHCVLLPESKGVKGVLQKVKDYCTFGEISDELLELLISKRGRKPGNKRLTEEEAREVTTKLKEEGKLKGIKPVFRLTPPSKGFKRSIKQHWPKGELGYRGEKINDLLKRMI